MHVDRESASVDSDRNGARGSANGDVLFARPGVHVDALYVNCGQLEDIVRCSAVDGNLPANAGVELQGEDEAGALEEEAGRVALRDLDLAARGVQAHVRLASRVLDVRAKEVVANGAASLHGYGRSAHLDPRARVVEAPNLVRGIQGLDSGRDRTPKRHVSRRAADREHHDQRGGNFSVGSLQGTPDDELQTDHDQDQRPQVHQAVETFDRYETYVDQERENANQDQDPRPEEAPVSPTHSHQLSPTSIRRAFAGG